MHPSEPVNHLLKFALAGELRCEACARLARAGPLKALLLLQAAAHRADAARLTEAVVILDGPPHSGLADALVDDPLGPGFPTDAGDDGPLLAACIDEEQQLQQRFAAALDHGYHWPDEVTEIVVHCERGAAARARQLGAAFGDSPPAPVGAVPESAP